MSRSIGMRAALATLGCGLALGAAAPAAHAAFGITDFGGALTQPGTVFDPDSGANALAAGGHPDFTVSFQFPFKPDPNTSQDPRDDTIADGNPNAIDVSLPRGFNANPSTVPTCSQDDLSKTFAATCQTNAQVGVLNLENVPGDGFSQEYPIYRIDPPKGVAARFGTNIISTTVTLDAIVRPGGGYALRASAKEIPETLSISRLKITLWGVPADTVHDPSRFGYSPFGNYNPGASSTAPPTAFTNNPTSCSSGAASLSTRVRSWQDPSTTFTATDSTEPDGTPFAFTGCASLPFAPTASVKPTTTAPDAPTGLDVSVSVPQSTAPDVSATAHLRDLKLTLPPGMSVNPSAATGLGSCSSAQIDVNGDGDPACPDSAKLGSVAITTPLLEGTLNGSVYLGAQNDNPFGSLLSLYLVVDERGVMLKLPGKIDADPATGQLTATFAQNPQLPFSQLDVHLNGGSRAALATPATCGTKTATVDMTPWSGTDTVSSTTDFTVDCSSGLASFAPGFRAGTVSSTAGSSSPLIVSVDRADGQQTVNGLSLNLPTGLLASLRGVRQCASAQADAGTCDALARVGSATIDAGAGATPFSLGGDVYLTGPYKGAPFGLAVKVRAVAGPLDLGTVIVRQALFIDHDDTHVRVVSDPIPTILQGIPIRLRALDVNVDRPGFALNPTSCASKSIGGVLSSPEGGRAVVSTRFQAANCKALPLTPKLALRLLGKGAALRDGGHPAVKAILTQPAGQSNLKRAEVALPLSLALDPDNAQTLCEYAEGRTSDPQCPKGSIVGTAKARTALLPHTLTGPVYFVKGQRTDPKTKRVIKTLPTLVIPLSGDGVRINLRAKTAVSGGRLVTTFDPIPDAPVSRFDFHLDGGSHGILVANSSVCRKPRGLGIGIRGQNSDLFRTTPTLAASCGK